MKQIRLGSTVKIIKNTPEKDNYRGSFGEVVGITAHSVLVEIKGRLLYFQKPEIELYEPEQLK